MAPKSSLREMANSRSTLLIDHGVPVVGIVHVPVLGVTYSGSVLEEIMAQKCLMDIDKASMRAH